MGRGGRRTKAAVALAAGALPFALGVGTASADDLFIQFFSQDHTFTANDGTSVTCTVSGESSLPCTRPSRFHSVSPWRTTNMKLSVVGVTPPILRESPQFARMGTMPTGLGEKFGKTGATSSRRAAFASTSASTER